MSGGAGPHAAGSFREELRPCDGRAPALRLRDMLPFPLPLPVPPVKKFVASSCIEDQLGTHDDDEDETEDAECRFVYERLADVGLSRPPVEGPSTDNNDEDDAPPVEELVLDVAFVRRLRARMAAASPSGALMPEDENIGSVGVGIEDATMLKEKRGRSRVSFPVLNQGILAGISISDWAQL